MIRKSIGRRRANEKRMEPINKSSNSFADWEDPDYDAIARDFLASIGQIQDNNLVHVGSKTIRTPRSWSDA